LEVVPFSETEKYTFPFYMELLGNLFSRLPYILYKYVSREMIRTVARVYQEERPDVVMCDYIQPGEGLRGLPGVPFVLFEHNVEAAIFDQLAERSSNFIVRRYIQMQANRLRRYEKELCQRAQKVIAVSDVDREVFIREFGVTDCDVVPTGVDTDFLRPSPVPATANNLVFVGSMDWMANQDGMKWFVHEIFPHIRAEVPDVQFTMVGRKAPPDILKLGEEPGVHVTGTVDDIRPFAHDSKVYVVPLRIGSGTRLKMLEAMALGKAIVSTALGAEGLPVKHGENIVLADEPLRFAQEVVDLLRDPQRRSVLETNARELVERDYSWEQVGKVFNRICQDAAAGVKGQQR
jgi:polysaccharide biosynthesis protein PslH